MLYICDTCILIDYLKGITKIQAKLSKDRVQGLGMSAVTYCEKYNVIKNLSKTW